jgi:hypothetical protein
MSGLFTNLANIRILLISLSFFFFSLYDILLIALLFFGFFLNFFPLFVCTLFYSTRLRDLDPDT